MLQLPPHSTPLAGVQRLVGGVIPHVHTLFVVYIIPASLDDAKEKHPCILIMDVIDRITLGPQEAVAQQGRHVYPNQSPNSW